jgi:hypothetical protein
MSIIVEGPDGAGKTTLISLLQHLYPGLEIHERFTRSVEGPYPDIAERVYRSVRDHPTHCVHDRHPIISEYVYGSTIPTRHVNTDFLKPSMAVIRQRIANNSLVIWCLPPLEKIKHNIEQEQQMEGVVQYIDKIYEGYLMQRLFWRGAAVTYDYTHGRAGDLSLADQLTATDGKYWKAQKHDHQRTFTRTTNPQGN